jgi:SNF2 family DNA or RNA helicase
MRQIYQPLDYQPQMIDWLRERESAALFCSPGLGKTVTTLKAWHDLYRDCRSRGMLVVAPIRVCNITWPRQVERWDFCRGLTVANLRTAEGIRHWEQGTADIYVINSEMLATRETKHKCPACGDGEKSSRANCETCEAEGFVKRKYPGFVAKHLKGKKKHQLPVDTLVIDELSLAKSPDSKRFNALRHWTGHFDRVWGLTGTPAPNSYNDLWAQIRFLDGGQRLGLTHSSYQQAHFHRVSVGLGAKFSLKRGSKEEIEQKISDLCLTMLSDDYLDVPTCNYEDVEVTLPSPAKTAYNQLKKQLLLEIETGQIEALHAAALTNKLLQITGGAVYDAERTVHYIHDAKIKALKTLINQHKGEPILVLTQFKHEMARILEAFPQAEKFDEKNLARWQAGKIPVWVADPRSMSHGIDGLQESGRIAIWFTLTYSNETYIQTNARLVRTGQSSETIIYRLVAAGTVDEAVAEAIREKGDQQQGLFEALKNLQMMERMA